MKQFAKIIHSSEDTRLECEKTWIYLLLMLTGGYLGAYTYAVRGGVFCNAQTANFVLFAMALGGGKWAQAAYYIIPMTAYFTGTVLSEWIPKRVNRLHLLRWDTVLVGIEALVLLLLGFIPDSAPFQISQVTINLICSMQYNTFRQTDSVPMATTFCTNHLRQTGVNFVKWRRHGENPVYRHRFLLHVMMLSAFVVGGVISTILCGVFYGRAVWGAVLVLLVIFIDLLRADLTFEKDQMERKPAGH